MTIFHVLPGIVVAFLILALEGAFIVVLSAFQHLGIGALLLPLLAAAFVSIAPSSSS